MLSLQTQLNIHLEEERHSNWAHDSTHVFNPTPNWVNIAESGVEHHAGNKEASFIDKQELEG